MQNRNLRGCIRPLAPAYAVFDFQNNQDGLRIKTDSKKAMRWGQLLMALQLHMITRGHPRMIIVRLSGNSIDLSPKTLGKQLRKILLIFSPYFPPLY